MIATSLLTALIFFWPSRWRVALVAAFLCSPFMPHLAQVAVLSLVALAVMALMASHTRRELTALRRRSG